MQHYDEQIWEALIAAIRADDGKSIDLMGVAGAHPWIINSSNPTDPDAKTPLMWAYWLGKPIAASALLRCGANYQQEDAHGNGARWYAERFGLGVAGERFSGAIDAGKRRLSMESLIDRAKEEDAALDKGSDPVRPQPLKRFSP